MSTHSLRPALAGGRPLYLFWLALGSPVIADVAAQARPDALVLDLQHGLWRPSGIEAAIGSAGGQLPVIARCTDASATAIGQALDAGASAVLAPLVEDAGTAAAVVAASHYPPRGIRSAGGVRTLLGGLTGMLDAGREIAVGVMIETAAGVEQAEAIAAVPGLDFLFIGTGDLALSIGLDHPAGLEAACLRILAAARAHQLPCGIYTGDAESACHRTAQGFTLAVCGNDFDLLQRGCDAAVRTVRAGPETPGHSPASLASGEPYPQRHG
ncbi:MAG: HpcH/HpaI aldolase/citrate lyase family protein [Pigmentiphaga sp.]